MKYNKRNGRQESAARLYYPFDPRINLTNLTCLRKFQEFDNYMKLLNHSGQFLNLSFVLNLSSIL